MIIPLNLQLITRKGHTIATAYYIRIVVYYIPSKDLEKPKQAPVVLPLQGHIKPGASYMYVQHLRTRTRERKMEESQVRLLYFAGYVGILLYHQSQYQRPLGVSQNGEQTISLALVSKQCRQSHCPQTCSKNNTVKKHISCLNQMSVPSMCFRKAAWANSRAAGINPLSTLILMMS